MSDKALTDFVEEVCGPSHLRIEDDFGDGFVRLKSSEAQKRQAKHDIQSSEDIVIEMLRNARDAHARTIFLATTCKEKRRHIIMLDDGDGIPETLHRRVFEPRVTSKLDTMHVDKWGVHGRGMALYSIAENTEKAYVVASDKGLGSSLVIESDLTKLSERKDQSTFPQAVINENNALSFRGPRNITRTVCEFAFMHRKDCRVYYGTPTEIAASLYAFGKLAQLSDCSVEYAAIEQAPIVLRLALTATPAEFSHTAQTLGLVLSERSARRILDGEIKAVPSVYELIAQSLSEDASALVEHSAANERSLAPSRKKIAVAKEDLQNFTQAIKQAYEPLADSYYLDSTVEPSVKVRRDTITINIPLNNLD